VESSKTPNDQPGTLKIGFPVKCHYRGGHNSLGKRGTHLWISQGRIGYGEVKLTHGFPLSEVSSVDVKPILRHSGIPYYDDLPPRERTG